MTPILPPIFSGVHVKMTKIRKDFQQSSVFIIFRLSNVIANILIHIWRMISAYNISQWL